MTTLAHPHSPLHWCSASNQLTPEDAAILARMPAGVINRDNTREANVFRWLHDRRDFRPDVRVTWQDMEIMKARIRNRIAAGAA